MPVRDLDPAHPRDVAALEALLATVPDFSQRVSGRPPAPGDAADALTAAPPGVPADRKHAIGLWADDDPGRLLGFADLLRGWPSPESAHLGLLVTDGRLHGGGLGRHTSDAVVARVRDWPEVTRIQLAVVATNEAAAGPFWRRLGFRPTGRTAPYSSGSVRSTKEVWTARVVDL
ncbi:GNAT family N-acetyltransferase [Nocardioides sp. ChNu-99]|uniref:GNAT family N-acetyltransferase n=1 Tax=Nocardioides sp. ChNu-99 TaxID=2839897 RepID=UPI0024073464|nr:GNAT family N-acetyltransferase [Nocardioides sp. ChNu-99]MDF9717142.1 GNAT family N-acetyltransferase [Nocardioides sp. ChNu-99]